MYADLGYCSECLSKISLWLRWCSSNFKNRKATLLPSDNPTFGVSPKKTQLYRKFTQLQSCSGVTWTTRHMGARKKLKQLGLLGCGGFGAVELVQHVTWVQSLSFLGVFLQSLHVWESNFCQCGWHILNCRVALLAIVCHLFLIWFYVLIRSILQSPGFSLGQVDSGDTYALKALSASTWRLESQLATVYCKEQGSIRVIPQVPHKSTHKWVQRFFDHMPQKS